MSSTFLSRGLTKATFALLGKRLHLKLLFIAIDNGILKGSAAILTKAKFLETMLRFFTIYRPKNCVIVTIFFCCNSTPDFKNYRMIFIGITYNINCLFVVIKALFFGYVSGFFTTRFFNNVNPLMHNVPKWSGTL